VSPDGLVRRLVDYFGISPDRVTVQDSTPDVVPVICRSDLLIMPSLSEGTPFAMVEAMIGARPAVGTPAGGIPELIQEGQTGWLARSTEVPDVADALERAWAQRKSWRDVGQRAQAAVIQQYDQDTQWPRVIDALAEDIA
jgi:glycosyltransferase involved in cell wall biosynthesis